MLKRIKNFFIDFQNRYEGVAAVEFAMVSSAFILLLFGTIEGGRLVWTMNIVQYTIEKTSRHVSLNPDLQMTEIEEYAQTELSSFLVPPEQFELTDISEETINGTDFVELEGEYDYQPLLSLLLPWNLGNINFQVRTKKPIVT